MPSTSRMAFVLTTLANVIDDDTTFDVRKVFTKNSFVPATSKALVYINVISDAPAAEGSETRRIDDLRHMRVGIYIVGKTSLDTAQSGTGAVYYGQLVEKLEKRIDALSVPVSDTTTAGYTVTLHDIMIDSISGHIDDGEGTVAFLAEADVFYTQY